MSRSLNNKKILKNIETNKNLSNSILYSDLYNDGAIEFEKMKKGYIEMGKLNLAIAHEYDGCGFIDVDIYETWLCGEWFIKWQQW